MAQDIRLIQKCYNVDSNKGVVLTGNIQFTEIKWVKKVDIFPKSRERLQMGFRIIMPTSRMIDVGRKTKCTVYFTFIWKVDSVNFPKYPVFPLCLYSQVKISVKKSNVIYTDNLLLSLKKVDIFTDNILWTFVKVDILINNILLVFQEVDISINNILLVLKR